MTLPIDIRETLAHLRTSQERLTDLQASFRSLVQSLLKVQNRLNQVTGEPIMTHEDDAVVYSQFNPLKVTITSEDLAALDLKVGDRVWIDGKEHLVLHCDGTDQVFLAKSRAHLKAFKRSRRNSPKRSRGPR